MTRNDGGPAFPIPVVLQKHGDVYHEIMTGWQAGLKGMTLRDYFAGQALAGMYSSPYMLAAAYDDLENEQPDDRLALWAYDQADAMIAKRERPDDA